MGKTIIFSGNQHGNDDFRVSPESSDYSYTSLIHALITRCIFSYSNFNPIAYCLLHSERPKLYGVLAVLSAVGLKMLHGSEAGGGWGAGNTVSVKVLEKQDKVFISRRTIIGIVNSKLCKYE